MNDFIKWFRRNSVPFLSNVPNKIGAENQVYSYQVDSFNILKPFTIFTEQKKWELKIDFADPVLDIKTYYISDTGLLTHLVHTESSQIYMADFVEFEKKALNRLVCACKKDTENSILSAEILINDQISEKINFHKANGGCFVAAYSVGLESSGIQHLQFGNLFIQFKSELVSAQNNSILNFISFRQKNSERDLLELWNKQTLLKDLGSRKHLNLIDGPKAFWGGYLSFLQESVQSYKEEEYILEKYARRLFQIPDSVSDIQLFLVNWWENFSQPAFRKLFQTDPQLSADRVLILILFFRKWMIKVPELLRQKFNEVMINSENKQFAQLINFLTDRFVYDFNNNEIIVYPTSKFDNNYKSIKFGSDLVFKFTKFGNSVYTKLLLNNKCLLKLDKLVAVSYKSADKEIVVLDAIRSTKTEVLKIQYSSYTVKIPLCWRNFELSINSLKLKAIFKKCRFQFTLHGVEDLILDEKMIPLRNKQKTMEYREVKPGKTSISSYASPNGFNNYFNLHVRDKYGIHPEYITIKSGPKNRVIKSDFTGCFYFQTKNNENPAIRLKNEKTIIHTSNPDNKIINTIKALSPEEIALRFFVGMDVQWLEHSDRVRELFFSEFGIIPIICTTEEIPKIINGIGLYLLFENTPFNLIEEKSSLFLKGKDFDNLLKKLQLIFGTKTADFYLK